MDLHFASSYLSPSNVQRTMPLNGLRVLVVDDNEETREALYALLSDKSINVMLAESGKAAMDLIMALPFGELPEILICDIAMPEQDGYMTLATIRQWEAKNCVRIPMHAIAFTAFSLREDKLRAMAYGFQAHLSKPLNPERLYATLEELSIIRKSQL